MQEFKQATNQTKTFAGELLKALATKGCIEYQRVEICKDCMLFIQVTEFGKPPHELCDETPPPTPPPTPIDYRDMITEESDPEEDERETLRQAIMELGNEKTSLLSRGCSNLDSNRLPCCTTHTLTATATAKTVGMKNYRHLPEIRSKRGDIGTRPKRPNGKRAVYARNPATKGKYRVPLHNQNRNA